MPQDMTIPVGERRRKIVGTIAIAIGILGGTTVAGAFSLLGVQVVTAFIPVT